MSDPLVDAPRSSDPETATPGNQPDIVPMIHWNMEPDREPDDDFRAMMNGMLLGAVVKFNNLLGLPGPDIGESLVPTTLFTTSAGKDIRCVTSMEPDSISPLTWRGAGSITPSDGHRALLFMLFLEQKLPDSVALDFGNDHGDELAFGRFGYWKDVLVSMGFDYVTVLGDAVTLGLALEPIRIPDSSDIDNAFF